MHIHTNPGLIHLDLQLSAIFHLQFITNTEETLTPVTQRQKKRAESLKPSLILANYFLDLQRILFGT